MAPTMGTSSSFIGRMSTASNSRSRLTLDTGTHLARELQIFPRLALIGRGTQQISGMLRYHQRHVGETERMHLQAQPSQGGIGLEQVLRRDPPHRQHDLWLEQGDLPLEIG